MANGLNTLASILPLVKWPVPAILTRHVDAKLFVFMIDQISQELL